ncbi:hypothetical protein [Catellatospora sichuanensis]|uniref:hypothetical protein n=1 Tax=Catellatospora sichuanensis TaxID=1969805 RepID=UPI0011821A95|nr:hypothetical protein [Catellatospora sichuanensis]
MSDRKTRLVTVDANSTAEDPVRQGPLALDAEQADFDEFVQRALAMLRLQHGRRAAGHHSPAEAARPAFDQEITHALAVWLHQLPAQRAAPRRPSA